MSREGFSYIFDGRIFLDTSDRVKPKRGRTLAKLLPQFALCSQGTSCNMAKITAACGIFQSDSALSKSSSSATLLFHCCSSGRRGPAPAVLLMVVVGAARRLAWPCCCCYRKLCVTPIVLPCHCHALTQCQRTHNALGNQRVEEVCE